MTGSAGPTPAMSAPPPGRVSAALARHEVVVHLFAGADGPAVEACWAYLRATWRRCVDEFGLTSPLRAYAEEMPERCPAVVEGDTFLAACGRPGPGAVELVARQVHDVVCLSLVIAPEDGTSWAGLLASWRAVRGDPPAALLGSVMIALAVSAESDAPPDVAMLTSRVAGELPLEGLLLRGGTLREAGTGGPYAMWEAVADSDAPASVNRRSHRDLVIVAPAGGMPQLSAWTWSRGGSDRDLPPFARYSMHAAKLRYCARVRAESSFGTLRAEIETMLDRPAGRLRAVAAGATSLQRSVEKIQQLRLTAGTAARNLARNASGDQRGGMFADDEQLGEWLEGTLATDLRYLEVTLGAARRVLAAPPPDPPDPDREDDDVDLRPAQRRALIAALESAYPTYRDLGYMFDTELGRKLARDAREDGIRLVLNDVVGRAVAEGRLDELIAAAIAGNPGNDQLSALHTSGLSPHSGAVGARGREFAEKVIEAQAGFRSATVFLARLLRLAGRVCLIEVITGGHRVSGGTGFLVGPDLVLTNHHVLERVLDGRSDPADVTCTFDFHELPDGSLARGSAHGLAPDGLVANSPDTPTGLDYALVRLAGSPGADRLPDGTTRGAIELPRQAPNLVVGTPLLILQHPAGHPLQLAWANAGVVGVDEDGMRISHTVNTAAGSSGSPCLTYDLELVALHRGRADDAGLEHNRAVPIQKIMADLPSPLPSLS